MTGIVLVVVVVVAGERVNDDDKVIMAPWHFCPPRLFVALVDSTTSGAAVGATAFLVMKDSFCPNHVCGKHADEKLVSIDDNITPFATTTTTTPSTTTTTMPWK